MPKVSEQQIKNSETLVNGPNIVNGFLELCEGFYLDSRKIELLKDHSQLKDNLK